MHPHLSCPKPSYFDDGGLVGALPIGSLPNCMGRVLIIIPTYNEVDNIATIVGAINQLRLPMPMDILIVDDNSPDGTGKIADGYASRISNLFVLHRNKKEGLAAAYIDGFRWGFSHLYDWVIQMDADLSHDPIYLGSMFEFIGSGQYDLVIGSRYVAGGGSENWNWFRWMISRAGNQYASTILGERVSEFTGGFNAWRSDCLARLGLESIQMGGYGFQIELKYRACRAGLRWVEFPIVFRERKSGASKMNLNIVFEALADVPRLRMKNLPEP
jgi:dolichol-phosphate mannosyltransferase